MGFLDILTDPVQETAATIGDNRTSIDAIVNYFKVTEVKTPAAQKVKEDFFTWYDSLWVIGSDEDYKRASNFRNDFNRANAVNKQEKKRVEDTIKHSVDSPGRPDLQGRKTASGDFLVTESIVPTWAKSAGYGVGAGILLTLGFKFFRKFL